MSDHIWREWAMCWFTVLNVTCTYTEVVGIAAIKRPFTLGAAVERSNPSLILELTFTLIVTLRTWYRLFDSTAIATRVNQYLAAPTQSLMTASLAIVLSTGKKIITDLPTTPSAIVVRILTPSRRGVLPTKTWQGRPHVRTRRTWSSMTDKLTRMRTMSHPRFGAGLPTRMRWQARQRSRLYLLRAPACIRAR